MIMDTDASDVGISDVLLQVQKGTERVLAYGSCKLTKTEQNTRQELLAVMCVSSHHISGSTCWDVPSLCARTTAISGG